MVIPKKTQPKHMKCRLIVRRNCTTVTYLDMPKIDNCNMIPCHGEIKFYISIGKIKDRLGRSEEKNNKQEGQNE